MPALGIGGLLIGADRRADRNLLGAESVSSVGAGSATRSATPVLSVRRAPTALVADATRQRYRTALDDVATRVDDRSCFAASLDGTPLLAVGGDRSVVPASNLKLVTAAVALEVLGADHTFTTRVSGTLVGDTVDGDLFLIGGGDATLATNDYLDYPSSEKYPPVPFTSLDVLADQIYAAGVRRVTGRVVGDESRDDLKRQVDAWQDGIYREDAGPLSALLVNDGYLDPADEQPATEPAATAASHLLRLLADRGVTIEGGSGAGFASAGLVEITSISSLPLSAVLGELLTTSDDNTAEMLVKEIGLVRSGTGSTAAGLAVEREVLTSWGVPMEGVVLVDGSGLADTNRVTCPAMLAVLDHLGATGPVFDGLPVAGQTGTLAAFFIGTPVEGRLRAKTGNLSVARALSGFFPGSDHTVSFSLIVNGPDNDNRAEKTLWPRLAAALGSIPAALSPDELAPQV